jgi:hypothetical protein
MRKEKKERKIVNYRIETCRRVLISTPVYKVDAGPCDLGIVTYKLDLRN